MANVEVAAGAAPKVVVAAQPMRKKNLPEFVKIWEHERGIFLWPIWFTSLNLWWLMSLGWVSSGTAGWWFLVVSAISILGANINVGRMMFAFIMFTITIVALVMWVVGLTTEMTPYHTLGNFLHGLDMSYNPTFGLGLGAVALIAFLWSMSTAQVDGRWHFGSNDFEHFRAGIGEGSTPRAGRTMRAEYHDVLKFLLGFGAGNIRILVGARGKEEEAKIENVFFLVRRWKVVSLLASSTNVTQRDIMAAAILDESTHN